VLNPLDATGPQAFCRPGPTWLSVFRHERRSFAPTDRVAPASDDSNCRGLIRPSTRIHPQTYSITTDRDRIEGSREVA